MIDFDPNDEQRMMRDTVADFARTKLRPRARATEAARALPADLAAAAVELGLGALALRAAHGGPGIDAVTAVLVEEEIAWADPGAAFAIPGPGALAHALIELADDAQQARCLAQFASDPMRIGAVAFSEASPSAERAGLVTTARRDGATWVVDGAKSFVLNAGLASSYVVFAQVDRDAGWDGMGAFVVDANVPGLSTAARHTTLGLDAASFGEVSFSGVRVSDDARLLGRGDFARGLRRFFARHSLVIAARAVGVAQAAWELARDYADERRAFGKPIGHFQAIAFALADRLMDVDGARGLLWRAAWTLDLWDASGGAAEDDRALLTRCAEAVAEATEVAMRCAEDAVQIHGGAGFVRDFLAEKTMRDARQIALCGPTATTSDQIFAALELGAPLDPALVLPTPDIQPIFL